MTDRSVEAYDAPQLVELGSLHEHTLTLKDFTGDDGIILVPPGITLGDVS